MEINSLNCMWSKLVQAGAQKGLCADVSLCVYDC